MAFYQNVAKAFSKAGALDFSGVFKAVALNDENVNQVAKNVARNSISALNSESDVLMSSIKKMKPHSKELADATEQLAKISNQISGLNSAYETGTMDAVNSALKEVTGKDKMGYMNFASGYFGDEQYGATRVKAALGAGATAMVGTRYLSGGSFATNNKGERDIVGIPFI